MRITLLTSSGEKVVELVEGATLLKAAVRARLPIGRSCRGVGICAACRVYVVEGAEHLRPLDEVEAALARRVPLGEGQRYACRARADGPCTITTTYW